MHMTNASPSDGFCASLAQSRFIQSDATQTISLHHANAVADVREQKRRQKGPTKTFNSLIHDENKLGKSELPQRPATAKKDGQ